jgi:biopolymer transport protein ExbD
MASIEELETELRELLRQSATPAGNTPSPATPGRRPMIGLRADRRNTYARIIQILSLGRELNVDVYQMVDPGGADKDAKRVLENDE